MTTKITTTIEAGTVNEYKELVKTLYGQVVLESLQVANSATHVKKEKAADQSVKKGSKAKKEDSKPVEKKQEVYTESTSDIEPSETGEVQEPTKEKKRQKEPEKSITVGKYQNATKADVQSAMKNAMVKKKRDAILTAFGRFNAEKLSDLEEKDYSAFITDLEALVGD